MTRGGPMVAAPWREPMPTRAADGSLTPTPISELILVGVMAGLLSCVAAYLRYGAFPPITITMGAVVIALAAVCAGVAWWIRSALAHNRIGMDRSQLNPVSVAWAAAVGGASAYFGAITAGAALGLEIYLLPRVTTLAAAAEDQPGVLLLVAGGLALTAAGIWLERSCLLPPQDTAAGSPA